MAAPIPILVPLLNPNETEACLADLRVRDGQPVRVGEVLATLETTKSAADLVAEHAGYLVGLRCHPGDTLRAGEIFAYIAEAADEPAPAANLPAGEQPLPEGLRITQPALALARQRGLELARLPLGPLVTESQVRALIAEQPGVVPAPAPRAARPAFDPAAILVYGGGGHGRSLIDLIRLLGRYRLAGVVDDGLQPGETVLDVPVLGGVDALADLRARGVMLAVNAVGGIGNIAARIRVFERLSQAGLACPSVVHPTAFVEPSAALDAGAQVFAHAYIGSAVQVGYGAIVNTGAIVSHDCRLGDYANISPGAILAGSVTVGERALVGMGVTVNLNVTVGAGARVGNGATVKADVPAGGVVRAGTIWPLDPAA